MTGIPTPTNHDQYYLDDVDPWRRVQQGLGALGAVLVIGTIAYRLLGLSWLDAFYQVVITVTTVGYGEIPPPSGEITGQYRFITSILVLSGVAIGIYTLGVFFEALIEGRLTTHIGRIRMQKRIDDMADHIIICGYGQVGQAIADAVSVRGEPVVVVDLDREIHDASELPTVRGDATDDDVLQAAGIMRARSLVTALDTDAGNVFVTITARTLRPSLLIVSRANELASITKLEAAGANRVVSPHQIGGARMASHVLEPNVADFVGESMNDGQLEVRLAETEVEAGNRLADRTIEESGIRQASGVIVLAIRRPDGTFVHQPGADAIPHAGDVLITLGTAAQQYALRTWVERL